MTKVLAAVLVATGGILLFAIFRYLVNDENLLLSELVSTYGSYWLCAAVAAWVGIVVGGRLK